MSKHKISKKRLAQIIKEEYQSLQHKKTRRLNEDASDDTFEMVDVIVQALGPQQALEELVQAMERSSAQELLGYVMQMHDMRMPGDEVEDYDPSAYNRKDETKKPDFLDLDKDGDEEESMEKAEKEKKVKKESLDSIRDLIQQELQKL